MIRWHRSIITQVILLVAIPVVVMFLAMIYESRDSSRRMLIESLKLSVNTFSQTINLAVSVHLGSGNSLASLTPFLNEFISEEQSGIVYLKIRDEQGNTIARTNNAPNLDDHEINAPIEQAFDRDEVYDVGIPVLLQGDDLGTLHYGLALSAISEDSRRINDHYLLRDTFIALIFLLLAALASAWLMLRLSSRVRVLLSRSKAIGEGNYGNQIIDHGKDEIGLFSRQMEQMRLSIQSREQALRESREEAEQLNLDLEQALVKLERSQDNLVQSEKLAGLGSIVAAVAHELNTPIGNALTVSTGIEERLHEFEQAISTGLKRSILDKHLRDQTNASQIISQNLSKAADLLDSFKHVAVDQTSSVKREFNLKKTIADVVRTLSPAFKHDHVDIHIEIDDAIQLNSYPGPLGQVITNLINNAVQHGFDPWPPANRAPTDQQSASAKRIEISAQIDQQQLDQPHIELVVQDNGNGIPKQNLRKLFDPFFTTKLGKGGSGLGLNIVYTLVTQTLAGQVSVHSEPDKGARFVITLPMNPPAPPETNR